MYGKDTIIWRYLLKAWHLGLKGLKVIVLFVCSVFISSVLDFQHSVSYSHEEPSVLVWLQLRYLLLSRVTD